MTLVALKREGHSRPAEQTVRGTVVSVDASPVVYGAHGPVQFSQQCPVADLGMKLVLPIVYSVGQTNAGKPSVLCSVSRALGRPLRPSRIAAQFQIVPTTVHDSGPVSRTIVSRIRILTKARSGVDVAMSTAYPRQSGSATGDGSDSRRSVPPHGVS